MLKRQVVVRRHHCGLRDHLKQAGPDFRWLQIGDANSANAGALTYRRQQGLEQSEIAEVLAI